MRLLLRAVLAAITLALAVSPGRADTQFGGTSGVSSIAGQRGNIKVLPPSALPPPTATSAGGVMAGSAPAHQFQTGVGTNGAPLFGQPSVGDVIGALNKAGDTMSGDLASTFSFATKTTASCLTTDGNQPADGTQSWQPTCFGTWINQSPTAFSVFPTRGTAQYVGALTTTAGSTAATVSGLPAGVSVQLNAAVINDANVPAQTFVQAVSGTSLTLTKQATASATTTATFVFPAMSTGALIQSWADGNSPVNVNGLSVNFDIVGGTVSAGVNPQNNAVASFISTRQHPDAQGHTPPNGWSLNIDHHIAPGSGNVQSWLQELDLNNFNRSCGVGTGCISAWIWFNGTNAYANLAMMYGGGAVVTTFAGTATTSGNTLSVVAFTGGTPQALTSDLVYVVVDGLKYHATMTDATHATTSRVLPTHATAVAFTASIAQSHFGFFLNGYEQVLEADIRLADAATWGLQLYGDHVVGVDTTGDSLTRAISMKSGQTACWNSNDICFQHILSSNIFQLGSGAQVPFYVTLNDNVTHLKGLTLDTGNITLGTGQVVAFNGASDKQMSYIFGSNIFQFNDNAAGKTPFYITLNDDVTHVSNLTVDGTGTARFGTYTAAACTNAGYISIQDTSGTVRKVMICP